MSATAPDDLGRFGLLASAIARRPVDVATGDAGQLAWTDGVTVFVDAGASPREQVQSVGVQAVLLASGSLDNEIVGRLGRRPALARRYLAVEGHRALAAHDALLPDSLRGLVDGAAVLTDSPEASLAVAASRVPLDDPPKIFGALRPRHMRSQPEPGDAQVAQHQPRREATAALRELDDGEDDELPTLHLLSSPVGGGGAIGKLLKKLLGDGRAAGGGAPGADAPTHLTPRGGRVARTAALTTTRASAFADVSLVERGEWSYPEWDVFGHRYRHDWCTVVEADAEAPDAAPIEPHNVHALRRPLARLGLELERRRRQLQGDDIDIDAAVEALVELRAGVTPDEALFIDSVRRRRDLSVLVLLDVSGSAAEPSTAGTTVHEQQRATAASLVTALHDLGDRVALYAFRSHGRSAVQVVPMKRFDDPLDGAAFGRLGGLVPGGYTRLGAAIRHGASVLERSGGTSRRLLVVLSDGFAYDHGYQGAYGEADARRSLAEARRRGMGCLCLSIGADIDTQALQRVFGTAAHATVPRAEQLSNVIGPLFRSAISSAEFQRRVSQRKTRTRGRIQIERTTA